MTAPAVPPTASTPAATTATPGPQAPASPSAAPAPRRQVAVALSTDRRSSTAGRGVSVATAVASLDAARTGELPVPAPTATLLVATDPALLAPRPNESLLLGAAPVPAATGADAGAPVTQVSAEPTSWLTSVSTYGMPLLVGGALLLALTGQSGLRRWARRRREG